MSRYNALHRGTVILPTAAKYSQTFYSNAICTNNSCSRQEQTSCVYHIILCYRDFKISHPKAVFRVLIGHHLW